MPPKASTILNLSREEYDRIDALQLKTQPSVSEFGSVFTAYAKEITSTNAIADLYQAVKIRHPECNSIMMAYAIGDEHGNCDDGEYATGLRMQKLLEEMNKTLLSLSHMNMAGST